MYPKESTFFAVSTPFAAIAMLVETVFSYRHYITALSNGMEIKNPA